MTSTPAPKIIDLHIALASCSLEQWVTYKRDIAAEACPRHIQRQVYAFRSATEALTRAADNLQRSIADDEAQLRTGARVQGLLHQATGEWLDARSAYNAQREALIEITDFWLDSTRSGHEWYRHALTGLLRPEG